MKTYSAKIHAKTTFCTMVWFIKRGPPPWPEGNCCGAKIVGLDKHPGVKLLNMHQANLDEVIEHLGLSEIEVLVLANEHGYTAAIVTDPRVPKAWLTDKLCSICTPIDMLDAGDAGL